MTDFHTHILPGIDDGSPDIETTSEMIHMEMETGVDCIVATPHFYAHRMTVGGFLKNRSQAICKVREYYDRLSGPVPKIMVGAEVYYFAGMGRAKMLPLLTIAGTDTILVEMPFEQWEQRQLEDLQDLIRKQKMKVVLAHVERYIEFQKDKRIWNAVMDMDLIPQINAGSFRHRKEGFFRRDVKRRFCLDFVREHPSFIMGSDCHNMTSRRPNLFEGRRELREALGDQALARSDAAAVSMLPGAVDIMGPDYRKALISAD